MTLLALTTAHILTVRQKY